VSHHGNLFGDKATHDLDASAPAFEFHSFRAAFFDEPQGCAHGIVCARVVRAVGHVRD
jgi:hypothetical protein